MRLCDLTDDFLLGIAQSLLTADDYTYLPHMAATCHALHRLLAELQEESRTRRMRWSADLRSSCGVCLTCDGTVASIQRASEAAQVGATIRCATLLPSSGRCTFQIEMPSPRRLGMLDADDQIVALITTRDLYRSAPSGYVKVTISLDTDNGTLGFSTWHRRNQPLSVLRTDLHGSPLAWLGERIATQTWSVHPPYVMAEHLAVRPEYEQSWGAAIRRFLRNNMCTLVAGNHADEQHVRALCDAMPGGEASWRHVHTVITASTEPHYADAAHAASAVAARGHVTLLDALEPIASAKVFNMLIDMCDASHLVLLPSFADVERLVFAADAPFERACTPDGTLHFHYGGVRPPLPPQPAAPTPQLRGVALRPCVMLATGDSSPCSLRIRGWM